MQPEKKKLTGRRIEKIGLWAIRKRKTVPRQMALNKHRIRYWLSVGATPTRGVHRILEKFDMVPKKPLPFGSIYDYERPERSYRYDHFKIDTKDPVKVAHAYRQKLQEQMNIVERRRRLQYEAM